MERRQATSRTEDKWKEAGYRPIRRMKERILYWCFQFDFLCPGSRQWWRLPLGTPRCNCRQTLLSLLSYLQGSRCTYEWDHFEKRTKEHWTNREEKEPNHLWARFGLWMAPATKSYKLQTARIWMSCWSRIQSHGTWESFARQHEGDIAIIDRTPTKVL